MKSNTLLERIIEVMRKAPSRQVFCENMGITPSKLHEIFKGQQEIDLQLIQRIATYYPDTNLRWLLLGESTFQAPETPHQDDEFTITIRVAEERFKLRISRRDEEFYRVAAKTLKDKLSTFALKYPMLTTERILKIIAFQLAVELERQNDAMNTNPENSHCTIETRKNQITLAASANLRGLYELYLQKQPDYSPQKLAATVAYQLTCNNLKNSYK